MIEFKEKYTGRIIRAEIVVEIPTPEPLDVFCGYTQIISVEEVPGIDLIMPHPSDGLFDLYKVTYYYGRENDDPEAVEENTEVKYICKEYDIDELDEDEGEEE